MGTWWNHYNPTDGWVIPRYADREEVCSFWLLLTAAESIYNFVERWLWSPRWSIVGLCWERLGCGWYSFGSWLPDTRLCVYVIPLFDIPAPCSYYTLVQTMTMLFLSWLAFSTNRLTPLFSITVQSQTLSPFIIMTPVSWKLEMRTAHGLVRIRVGPKVTNGRILSMSCRISMDSLRREEGRLNLSKAWTNISMVVGSFISGGSHR